VIVGDPIKFDDIINMEKGPVVPRKKLYDAVAARIGDRLHELKAQVDTLAMEQEMRLQDRSPHSMERASGILHQVYWELFGMDNFISSADDDSMQTPETVDLPNSSVSEQHQHSHNKKVGFSYKMRGYMNQMELMSFAARGLFMNNNETKDSAGFSREIRPLKAWKQFFDAHVLKQWNNNLQSV
jgi:monolysocardiolipin acyltransferase